MFGRWWPGPTWPRRAWSWSSWPQLLRLRQEAHPTPEGVLHVGQASSQLLVSAAVCASISVFLAPSRFRHGDVQKLALAQRHLHASEARSITLPFADGGHQRYG